MRFKTSRTVIGFATITGFCAAIGIVAQVNQNLTSARLGDSRTKAMTTIAQHVIAETCRRSDGGMFQKQDIIEEESGKTPTACYENELGETAFVAYEGGKLVVKEVFSEKEVNAAISRIQKERK